MSLADAKAELLTALTAIPGLHASPDKRKPSLSGAGRGKFTGSVKLLDEGNHAPSPWIHSGDSQHDFTLTVEIGVALGNDQDAARTQLANWSTDVFAALVGVKFTHCRVQDRAGDGRFVTEATKGGRRLVYRKPFKVRYVK